MARLWKGNPFGEGVGPRTGVLEGSDAMILAFGAGLLAAVFLAFMLHAAR